jgi:putative redox protein
MQSKVVWKGDMAFTGTADNTYLIPLDASPTSGGKDLGFRPLQLMAIGLVGCTGMDVISILQKKRQEITAFEVSAHIDRADEHPKVFTKIVIEYKIKGINLDKSAVERAVQLSEEKYCGARAMLKHSAEISNRIIIEEEEEEE